MVKLFLSLVLLPTLALGQFSSPGIMQPATAAAAPSYDWIETFEASEYDNSGTESGTGTINGDTAHPSALSGGGSYCLYIVNPGTSATRVVWDHGSTFSGFGARFYLYIETLPVTNFDRCSVFALAAGNFFQLPFDIRIRNSSGTATIMLSGTSDQTWNVTTGAWYLVEVHGSFPSGTVSARIDGANEKSVTAAAYTPRYFNLGGSLHYKDSAVYVDNLAINFGTDAYP